MVKSDLKKSLPFKSYSKNSEWPSRKFLIKMTIFVLQRYVCYEYWAMCYEVFLMCYVSRPFKQCSHTHSRVVIRLFKKIKYYYKIKYYAMAFPRSGFALTFRQKIRFTSFI